LWHQYQITNFADPTTTTNQLSTVAPEPHYIVLVDAPKCYEDSFWYIISNDQYRSFINGIGCHKNCILPYSASGDESAGNNDTSVQSSSSSTTTTTTTFSEQEMIEEQREHIEAILQRVGELQLVLHVWTERPELWYFENNHPVFRTVMDEIYYLKCNVSHVHGIFTESVDMAVRALQIPCPTISSSSSSATTSTTTNTNYGSSQQTGICNDDNNNNVKRHLSIAGIVASFVLGAITTLLMNRFGHLYRWTRCCISTNKSNMITNHNGNKNSYQQATTIITSNDVDDEEEVDDKRNYDKKGFNGNPRNNGLELSSVT
jgi:hypothetical protein